ncbi:MAG: DUF433 domain-containing protein [Oscillatoriaceae cyanobacterium Prado104]|jgi:uncharacterized protein (DUF433 family)|nr:DUF433 domain-containing protein [Oscillatoriaceae cyanobacterium Prado104]
MSLTATEYKYIELDDKNVPIVQGTTMKVVELITSVKAYQLSPEELLEIYPHLTLSKIYSALAYYWDNKQELDADMQRRFEYAEKLRLEAGESPLAKKLRDRGLIK